MTLQALTVISLTVSSAPQSQSPLWSLSNLIYYLTTQACVSTGLLQAHK